MKYSRRQFIKKSSLFSFGCFASTSFFTKIKAVLGTTYYVSDVGGDDTFPGTLGQPFKTIQHAVDTVVAGDTVLIKAGSYNERVVFSTSGSQALPITIQAFDAGVVIDGTGISWNPPNATDPFNGLFDLFSVNYVTIQNLNLMNSTYAGFFMENCTNITISNCQTDNTVSSGIGVWGCDSIVVDNNTVQRACNGGGEECITLATTSNSEIKNNEIFNNIGGLLGGEGIDVKQGSHHVKIHHNHVHHLNGRLGIYADAYDTYTHDIEIYNNLVHDIPDSGIAVASEGGGLLENVLIYNNLVYNNTYGAIEVGGWTTVAGTTITPIRNIKIINNTLYNNQEAININNANAQNITVINNVCSQNRGEQIVVAATPMAEVEVKNCLIDGLSSITGTNAVMAQPLFFDTNNHDFHLSENSPAINAGTITDSPNFDFDNVTRNDGMPDIGAFEFNDLIFKQGFEN
jgi:polygalacturonase